MGDASTVTSTQVAAAAATTVLLVAANVNRIMLAFNEQCGNAVYINTTGGDPTLDGTVVSQATGDMRFNALVDGRAATSAWFGRTPAGALCVGVIQVIKDATA